MLYTEQQVLHLIENDETDNEKERKPERMKERKKERDKTVTKMVIKYMYIILKTTFTSICYILTNKCCTWLRMTRNINRRNLKEKRRATERMKDRKKKKERKMRQGSDTEWN